MCISCDSFGGIVDLADEFIPVVKHLNPFSVDSLRQKYSTMELMKEIAFLEDDVSFFQTGPCVEKDKTFRLRKSDPYRIHWVIQGRKRPKKMFMLLDDLYKDLLKSKSKLKIQKILENISTFTVKEKLELVEKLFARGSFEKIKHILNFLGIKQKKFSLKELAELKASFLEKVGVYDISFISHASKNGTPQISIISGIHPRYGTLNGKVYEMSPVRSLYSKVHTVYNRKWEIIPGFDINLYGSSVKNLQAENSSIIFRAKDGVYYHWLLG
jgi:hypothetical protein